MTKDAEQEIQALVEERVAAVAAKDPEPLAARQHDDIVVFDVLPPLRSSGRRAVFEKTEAWFDSYSGAIGYDLGCRRIDGAWRIVHDHESVSFDPGSGRALIDLAP
jgi:ketosteroid isomerase-like protein